MKFLKILLLILFFATNSFFADADDRASKALEASFFESYGYSWNEASEEVRSQFKTEYKNLSEREQSQSNSAAENSGKPVNTEVSYALKMSFLQSYGYEWDEASVEVQNTFFENYNKKTEDRREKQEKYDEILEKKRERIEKIKERELKKLERRNKMRLKKAEREAKAEEKERKRIKKAFEDQKEKIEKMRRKADRR